MYESFYGLREKPFNLLPDPDYLYMSKGHENAHTHLEYAIAENKGFVIITGEIGSGKTTLINFLLREIRQNILVGVISNTYVSPAQLIKMICQEFELHVEGLDKVEMVDLFHKFLLQQFAGRKRVILIIDEAQNLSPESMEEIRMLSNLETEKHHLIQMILLGQPELKNKLQRKDLEQFAQRVTIHCHLDALSIEETGQYIQHRLKVAGAKDLNIFNKEAIEIIYNCSYGTPRIINIICDTALVYGYADGLRVIDESIIENVIKEREEGGIFSDTQEDVKSTLLSHTTGTAIGESTENRLQLMERRIRLLENVVANMDQRLSILTKRRDERDRVVLELFKMLKSSLESRFNVLLKLAHLQKRMEVTQRKTKKSKTKGKKE